MKNMVACKVWFKKIIKKKHGGIYPSQCKALWYIFHIMFLQWEAYTFKATEYTKFIPKMIADLWEYPNLDSDCVFYANRTVFFIITLRDTLKEKV